MSAFPPDLFRGRRYAVVGLGRAGLAAMRALSGMGASVTGWDDAPFAREAAAREGLTIADPSANIADEDALILSPGIPHLLPVPHRLAEAARIAGLPILTCAELLYHAVRAAGGKARFAGITGTNGKSTTTALLACILAEAHIPHAAGANLGPPALSLPFLPDDGIYVLEMSSYMLERLATLRFDAACLLNLSPDHLDRHGDMDGYASAKLNIFARQQEGDRAVIGIDDRFCREIARAMPHAQTISGHAPAGIFADGTHLRSRDGRLDFDLREAAALPGSHNAQNAAAAAAMAMALGAGMHAIISGLRRFAGLPHRQELAGEIDGIRFINDSKATNADAASRALSCYGRVIWIAGGIAKEGGIDSLGPYFPRIAEALLIGRDATAFAATLSSNNVPHRIVENLENAVPCALERARALGIETVLLSPACASFDQFSGFEARGSRFVELVMALCRTEGS